MTIHTVSDNDNSLLLWEQNKAKSNLAGNEVLQKIIYSSIKGLFERLAEKDWSKVGSISSAWIKECGTMRDKLQTDLRPVFRAVGKSSGDTECTSILNKVVGNVGEIFAERYIAKLFEDDRIDYQPVDPDEDYGTDASFTFGSEDAKFTYVVQVKNYLSAPMMDSLRGAFDKLLRETFFLAQEDLDTIKDYYSKPRAYFFCPYGDFYSVSDDYRKVITVIGPKDIDNYLKLSAGSFFRVILEEIDEFGKSHNFT